MAKAKKESAETTKNTENLEEIIIQSLIEKKGIDIICINLKKINHVFFDAFIICTGSSKTHVETLSDFVQESVRKQLGTRASVVEGTSNGEWILLDYFNVIVHIFQPEVREYYNLEKLWNDADIQKF